MMIVKFHARGRGGGSGPVDYLLGKDRSRPGASVLQGRPEEVRELIDASPYVKKYTSGVLSFAEAELPPGQSEKLMASFEQILMPGLDKDQYSVLWVEHRDKGRLELNFLIPNVELRTGKRLQPYYDRADRPRVEAWQTIANGRLGLHDPNDPANRRVLTPPGDLPQSKQDAVQAITAGLLRLCESGEVKTRQDVTEALTAAGFSVVRTTKSSISIADPEGGRNIRLKGALYEQSFNAGEGLRREIEAAGEQYRRDAESRVQRAREICHRGTELKRAENQRRYSPASPGNGNPDGGTPEKNLTADDKQLALSHGIPAAGSAQLPGGSVVHVSFDPDEPRNDTPAEARYLPAGADAGRPGEERRETAGDTVRRREAAVCESGYVNSGIWGERRIQDSGGVLNDDGAGETAIARVRATAERLRAAAERMAGDLQRIAEDVWHYATGNRNTERAGHELEQAGAGLKPGARSFEQEVERVVAERNAQRLELEQQQRARRQRTRPRSGPSL